MKSGIECYLWWFLPIIQKLRKPQGFPPHYLIFGSERMNPMYVLKENWVLLQLERAKMMANEYVNETVHIGWL